MAHSRKSLIILYLTAALIGIVVDFIFNGVIVRLVFRSDFKESWMFIYATVDVAISAMLSSYLLKTKWQEHANYAAATLIAGAILGHLIFVGHKSVRTYQMNLVSIAPVLLRSPEWPQILFVEGDEASEAFNHHAVNERVTVVVSIVSDYGCIRSNIVETVAKINIAENQKTAWTWRLNRYAKTDEKNGPGNEDLLYPWCVHFAKLKLMDDGPPAERPWDALLKPTAPPADPSPE